MASTTKKGSTNSGATSFQTKTQGSRGQSSTPATTAATEGKTAWSQSTSAKVDKNNLSSGYTTRSNNSNTPPNQGLGGSTVSLVSQTNKNNGSSPTTRPSNYVVDKKIPQAVLNTMAPIPAPSFIPPAPADGSPNVSVEIRRAPESLDSAGRVDPDKLGRDVIIFYNHDRGEAVQYLVQTVSNAPDGQRGTIVPGPIKIKTNAPGTQMPEPDTVMTITEGKTLGGGTINQHGQAVYPDGTTSAPYRLHRDLNDFKKPGHKNVPTSGGCFTFLGKDLSIINKRLASWGVERGATIPGLIIQEQRR